MEDRIGYCAYNGFVDYPETAIWDEFLRDSESVPNWKRQTGGHHCLWDSNNSMKACETRSCHFWSY
jgi:hypothetical protein